MFSVKIIEADGHEFIKSDVKAVAFNPPFEQDNATLFIWYKDGLSVSETVYSGKIYVMNENGKTIADYFISTFPTYVGTK